MAESTRAEPLQSGRWQNQSLQGEPLRVKHCRDMAKLTKQGRGLAGSDLAGSLQSQSVIAGLLQSLALQGIHCRSIAGALQRQSLPSQPLQNRSLQRPLQKPSLQGCREGSPSLVLSNCNVGWSTRIMSRELFQWLTCLQTNRHFLLDTYRA